MNLKRNSMTSLKQRARVVWNASALLARNIVGTVRFAPIPSETKEGVIYQGLTSEWVDQVERLCVDLRGGRRWGMARSLLLRVLGKKLVVVAVSNEAKSKLLGVNVYYIERRDTRQGTIHAGFIGVVPEARGRGIATGLRRHAQAHFAACGILGITSRISASNQASLLGAFKVGFEVVEEFEDASRGGKRFYLKCSLT